MNLNGEEVVPRFLKILIECLVLLSFLSTRSRIQITFVALETLASLGLLFVPRSL